MRERQLSGSCSYRVREAAGVGEKLRMEEEEEVFVEEVLDLNRGAIMQHLHIAELVVHAGCCFVAFVAQVVVATSNSNAYDTKI